jgi:hypothetical protein
MVANTLKMVDEKRVTTLPKNVDEKILATLPKNIDEKYWKK